MVDASWALAMRGNGRFDPAFMVGATLTAYPLWVGGTAIGVLLGDSIGDPGALGLDALFPAFFLGLLIGGEAGRAAAFAAALLGAAIAAVLLPFAPPGVPIIAASAAALIGLAPERGSGDTAACCSLAPRRRRQLLSAAWQTVIWLTVGTVLVRAALRSARRPRARSTRAGGGRAAGAVLLAALVITQTFGDPEGGVTVDERVPAVAAAGVLLAWRPAKALLPAIALAGSAAAQPRAPAYPGLLPPAPRVARSPRTNRAARPRFYGKKPHRRQTRPSWSTPAQPVEQPSMDCPGQASPRSASLI